MLKNALPPQYAVYALNDIRMSQKSINSLIANADEGSAHEEWDYADPNSAWGGLCASGMRQSPINFVSAAAVAAPTTQSIINLASFQVSEQHNSQSRLSCRVQALIMHISFFIFASDFVMFRNMSVPIAGGLTVKTELND